MSGIMDELYFGGARVLFIEGHALDHPAEGFYLGANAQGVMAAGLQAEIRRVGGADVERELRSQGPLLVGKAYLTSPGALAEQGVRFIAHGVVVDEPGTSANLATSIAALLSGLRMLEDAGCRSVAVPQAGWRVGDLDQVTTADELGRVIITHLRRKSRLDQVSVVSRDPEYLAAAARSCRRAIELVSERGAGVGP